MGIQAITVILVGIVGISIAVEPSKYCYKDYPILDGLLCYKLCDPGYSHWGGGPLCWGRCPPSTTNIGLVCTKKTYGRGFGRVLSTCPPSQEKNGLLCYPKCKSGYYGVGPVCWAYCKSGYTDDGVFCRRNAHIYGRDVSSCPWYDICGLCAGPWYNVCGKRRNCGGKCKFGYKNDGCTCRKDVHIYAKSTYGRGFGNVMGCTRREEKSGLLCYPPCKRGYYGVGPVCWAKCSGETIDTGTQCQKKAYGRGVGKVVNCLNPVGPKDITNFDGLVDLFKKANGFQKVIQAPACSLFYLKLKPWVLIVQTFNGCFKKGDFQTISLSFSFGAAKFVSISNEIGVASDTKSRDALCFVGHCRGVKTDVSYGAEIKFGWWRSLDDIHGESSAFDVGFDIPFTELGIGATFVINTDGDFIGVQFAMGIGGGSGGPLPVELAFHKCKTPKEKTIPIRI